MLRTIALTFLNEFRLLVQDRIGLFMLLLAPIVIIAVAGFSLGNIYGARMTAHTYTVPVVDDDRFSLAALGNEGSRLFPIYFGEERKIRRISRLDGSQAFKQDEDRFTHGRENRHFKKERSALL